MAGVTSIATRVVAEPPAITCTGEGPPATPIASIGAVTVRDTFPLNPPSLVTVIVVVLYCPCVIVMKEGFARSVKSSGPTVTEIVIVWDLVPPEEVKVI